MRLESLLLAPFLSNSVSLKSVRVDFPLKKSHRLKMIFLNNHFTYFFSFFSSIFGWEDHFQLGSWCEGWLKLISSQKKPSKRLIYWKLRGLGIESRWFMLWIKYFWPSSGCLWLWWFWCGADCVVSLWCILLQRTHISLFFLCSRIWT